MNHAAQPSGTRTTCPYCGVGCGVIATPAADGSVSVAGDPVHPANFGRLCSKGSALGETLGEDGRLLHPTIAGRRASWSDALDLVAARFSEAIARHGPDSVAIYASAQMLTEDYYVANKLMKGFIGSANIDTNSRLCMASSVAGHKRAFGTDTVPGTYEDLEEAELLVLVGSNLAWCHPVLFQRIAAAKAARPSMTIVTIDPRRTATSALADLHLSIRPEGDAALFALLLSHLDRVGRVDRDYVAAHVAGFDEARAAAARARASDTGLGEAALAGFLDLFARTEKVVTLWSQGVNQSAGGTDKVNAILNCHLATGRIGRPGMGPFSVTGQPNAMGGREVGGMSNMLAAHMELADPAHREIVGRFWNTDRLPERPGLKAVELFEALAAGRIEALWIIGTNPAVSMPDAGRVREALRRAPFLVVSDIVHNDTAAFASVLLPAQGWGEKDGTVTNSERRISRQRAFLAPPGQTRPDWWMLTQVARRMGHGQAFAFERPAEIFAEHATLSGLGNEGTRDFDISGLAAISASGYETLQPVQWPVRRGAASGGRFFARGGFFTPDRRARMIAVQPAALREAPFLLNTGRIRDQWHTMTRTGRSSRLSAHIAEPFCEIAPGDADRLGIGAADLVCVETEYGCGLFRALVTERQAAGQLFVPMHWTAEFAPAGRIGAMVQPACDPHSGQPALKSTSASLERYPARWYGFAVVRERPDPAIADYVALARTDGGWRIELAGLAEVDPQTLAATLFGTAETTSHTDTRAGLHALAAFDGVRLRGALWVGPSPVTVSRAFAASLLSEARIDGPSRAMLLAGRPGLDRPDPGALVCACFSIGRNDIARAIDAGERTVQAIGACLKAGTNCGSCRSEIQTLIDERTGPASIDDPVPTTTREMAASL